MQRFVIGLFLLTAILASGCASVARGTSDTLIVNSDPTGALVELSNGLMGKTPATFKLPRKSALVVKISKEGYEPVDVNVTPQIAGAGSAGMVGNVFLGGIVGAAVDTGTGAMYDLKPNPISVKLVPLAKKAAPPPAAAKPKQSVQQRLAKLKSMRDAGEISQDEYEKLSLRIIDEH